MTSIARNTFSSTLLLLLVVALGCQSRPSANSGGDAGGGPIAKSTAKSTAPRDAAVATKGYLERFNDKRATHQATGRRFAVASQGDATTAAALQIFKAGGNVIDAMAAASFSISVERPHSTGLGGGGFLLFREAKTKKVYALDFREMAPAKATRDMFLDEKGEPDSKRSQYGALSSGVPGLVAGVLEAHRRWGKLPRARVLAPAIALAEHGMPVYPELNRAITQTAADLKLDPQAAAVFYTADGAPLAVGATLKQPGLAKALKLIASQGAKAFYRGDIARDLVAHQKQIKGLITAADLRGYAVKDRKPVSATVWGHQLHSMPPPSSGGTHVVQILKVVEALGLDPATPYATRNVSLTAQAMQHAFLDRAKHMGDSDFVKVPVAGLVSDGYAKRLAQTIAALERPVSAKDVKTPDPFALETPQTTHFSLIDADGNVAVSTQTINGWFGAQVMIPGWGIFMNNEMDDFSAKPGALNLFGAVGSTANEVVPRKRPLSSMSPTIIERDGQPVLALGSPSGTRIITCTALTALNRLLYKMDLFQAQSALRYHHQYLPDELRAEAPGLPGATREAIERSGMKVADFDLGCRVQAVERRESGEVSAVADPRGQGLAAASN